MVNAIEWVEKHVVVRGIAESKLSRCMARWAERYLYSNCFLTCVMALAAYALLCFMPFFSNNDHLVLYPDEWQAWDLFRDAVGTELCTKWLLVSIFVAIPLAFELVLDYHMLFEGKEGRGCWLASLVLVIAFIAPATIIYCLTVLHEGLVYNISQKVLQLRFGLAHLQFMACYFGVAAMMFGDRVDYPKSTKHPLLNFSVEKRTVNVLVLFTVTRVITTVGSSIRQYWLMRLGFALSALSTFLAVVMLARMLYVLITDRLKQRQFATHHHLSDFMCSCALMVYLIYGMVLRSITGYHPPSNETEAKAIILQETGLQIALVFFVTLTTGRKTKRLAEIKHEKLETRLNLIRYVSHEMRTPLNTAFMGLTFTVTALSAWMIKAKLEEQQQVSSSVDLSRLEQNEAPPALIAVNPPQQCTKAINITKSLSITSAEIVEVMETVEQVTDSCKVALATLDDLLTFDKIDEQKLIIEMQDIDPWAFVCSAAKPFAINAKQAQVKFAVRLQDRDSDWVKHHIIRGDPFKLSQVLRNLISNALKFTPPDGKVEIMLQRCPGFSAKDMVRISITDTGAGISLANQKLLFGQYVQFNAAALQQGKGSGLGLWITKSILEMHGGSIGVISAGEGCGSQFYVDLPSGKKSVRISGRTPTSLSLRRRSIAESANYALGANLIVLTENIPQEHDLSLVGASERRPETEEEPEEKIEEELLGSGAMPSLAAMGSRLLRKKTQYSAFGWLCSYFTDRNALDDLQSEESDLETASAFAADHNMPMSSTTFNSRSLLYRLSKARSGLFLNNPVRVNGNQDFDETSDEGSPPHTPIADNKSFLPDLFGSGLLSHVKIQPISGEACVDDNDRTAVGLKGVCIKPGVSSPSETSCLPVFYSRYVASTWEDGLKILVVDDSLPNRKICGKLLAVHNHSIFEAHDGQHCLEVYQEHLTSGSRPFDVVLLDDNMPRMAGPQAAQELRKLGFNGSIVGVTGDLYPETVARFISHGADDVLPKPLDLSLLRSKLDAIVKLHQV